MDEPVMDEPILHTADPVPHIGELWLGGILEKDGMQIQVDIRPGVNRYRQCSLEEDIFAQEWQDRPAPPTRIVEPWEFDAT